jgi:hypothetical protein
MSYTEKYDMVEKIYIQDFYIIEQSCSPNKEIIEFLDKNIKDIEELFLPPGIVDGTFKYTSCSNYKFLDIICPLSGKIYEKPVMYGDYIYEHKFINMWLQEDYLKSSPMTKRYNDKWGVYYKINEDLPIDFIEKITEHK